MPRGSRLVTAGSHGTAANQSTYRFGDRDDMLYETSFAGYGIASRILSDHPMASISRLCSPSARWEMISRCRLQKP